MFEARQVHGPANACLTKERGGIIAWLLLSFLFMCGLAVIACVYIVASVRVHGSRAGNDVRLETPFGSVHVQHNAAGQAKPAGLPVYPGAKLVHGRESATVDVSSPAGSDDLHIVAGRWETADPIDKVRHYYENRFPEMSVIDKHGQVEMHSIDGHSKRVIVLTQRHNSTEISLASVGEPRAN